MRHFRVKLHEDGPALWPTHKPLAEVLRLQETTPQPIWLGTYQGVPVAQGMVIFRKSWWRDRNRYRPDDTTYKHRAIGRWLSWDTANTEKETSAYTSCVVGELLPTYHLLIREVWRGHLAFPDLPDEIARWSARYNRDGKLKGVIIEDAASGTSAIASLAATGEMWLRRLIAAYSPTESKEYRAQQAAVWCKNGMIWLPEPHDMVPWLYDFEDEIFKFPGSMYKDQVDAFSQLILYLEHYLSRGYDVARTLRQDTQSYG